MRTATPLPKIVAILIHSPLKRTYSFYSMSIIKSRYGGSKMNELQEFVNEKFGTIRTIIINGEPYFVGKDVATALGYAKPTDAVRKRVGEEDRGISKMETPSGIQEMVIINESGLYSLIFGSKLDSAKDFKKWVTSEVLPSIRKHGIYATDSTIETMLNDPDTMIKVLTELKVERQQRILLEKENSALLPDVEMARDIIKYSGLYTLKEVADLIESGRTELCMLLRIGKVLSKQTGYNLPLNKYIKQGYFKIKIKEGYNTPVTLVTARGLKFIYRLIKKYDLVDEFDVETLLDTVKDMEVA